MSLFWYVLPGKISSEKKVLKLRSIAELIGRLTVLIFNDITIIVLTWKHGTHQRKGLQSSDSDSITAQALKYSTWMCKCIQGADDKLGQFLDQDIEASASHRNFLRHSLKSCSSLVSPNVNKPLISTKMSRQNTKIVQ